MAIKSTVFKADLQISDMDRHYYQSHSLTLAQHPSETDERMMVRLLAFALNADEQLTFGAGLSADDEPDLWHKDLTGAIEKWIDVGLPDEKLLRKACGRANQVLLYCYGGRTVDIWWERSKKDLLKLDNLSIYVVPQEASQLLAQMAQRTMQLSCTIQDGEIMLADDSHTLHTRVEQLK